MSEVGEDGRMFAKMYFDFIESKAFDGLSGNALKLYLRLRRYVCRARSGHSLSDFYVKGFLAVSGYLSQYADAFDVHKSSISRWLSELEEAQFIATYYKAQKGESKPNIWILGRVMHFEGSKYGQDVFFADHDALAQEPDERAAHIFDQSLGEAVTARMSSSANFCDQLCVAQVQRSVQRSVQHSAQQSVQPSNREEVIDKNNILPPSAKAEEPAPLIKEKSVSKILQSTITKGENEIERSPLAEYIGQQFNSPVPAGQCNKLAMGYTEHLPGGGTKKYPSPDENWLMQPHFQDWVQVRIDYIKGQGGSNAAKRNKAVNAICQYKGNKWAWLEWEAEQVDTPHFVDVEPPPDEPDAKPSAEMAAFMAEKRKELMRMKRG